MKRQRGRNNRRNNSGGNNNNPNRSLDSNGPDVKVRGSAATIYEKYTNLARDAKTSGNRVKAENYRQHAEHYFRLMRSLQPKVDPAAAAQNKLARDKTKALRAALKHPMAVKAAISLHAVIVSVIKELIHDTLTTRSKLLMKQRLKMISLLAAAARRKPMLL